MRSATALEAFVVVVLAATGCSPAATGGPSPTAPTSLPPTTDAAASDLPTVAPASPSPSSAAVGSQSPLAVADAACRSSTYQDPGTLTITATLGVLVTILYTSPDRDVVCQYQPSWGSTGVIQGPNEHLADRVTAGTPLVRDANFSFSGDIGTYIWGAVGPAVARVVIELGPNDRVDAVMGGGYFLAAVGPGRACCLYTAVALDVNGKELARAN
jgi:hypothetical protein